MSDYIKHIMRESQSEDNLTWCGEQYFGFAFINIEHAAENGFIQGRLIACPDCIESVVISLKNGWSN